MKVENLISQPNSTPTDAALARPLLRAKNDLYPISEKAIEKRTYLCYTIL